MKNAVQKAAVALVSAATLLFRFTVFLSATGFYARRCFIFNAEIADERESELWLLGFAVGWNNFCFNYRELSAQCFANNPA
jgi:hypothetical protein